MTRAGEPLLAFYGDDVTGSTDAMESFASQGIDVLLFVSTPSAEECRSAARSSQVVGIAGNSRAQDPAWMSRHLPVAFARLREMRPKIVHYKVCSTFDSAPEIGNIGRAIEIGRSPAIATPVIVGNPSLGRFTAFGNLFAAAGAERFRIDRHPTMSRHPVTPMHEADLRLHLAQQTALRCGLFDLAEQKSTEAEDRFAAAMRADPILLVDVLDDESQRFAGQQIWTIAQQLGEPLFCVGSSGVGAALIAHWRDAGSEGIATPAWPCEAAGRIAVVSGSCSPVTAGQIEWAQANGFDAIRADPTKLVTEATRTAEIKRVVDEALSSFGAGVSAIIFTALGPDDSSVASLNAQLASRGIEERPALAAIGKALGEILRRLIEEARLTRVAVAGGDTSGDVSEALGLRALRMRAPLAPGAPLCDGFAELGEPSAIEIALKGGQMGTPQYFGAVRAGRAIA